MPDAIDLERNVLTVKAEWRPSSVGEHVEFQIAERPSSLAAGTTRRPGGIRVGDGGATGLTIGSAIRSENDLSAIPCGHAARLAIQTPAPIGQSLARSV